MQRHQKQMLLPEIGKEGQNKINAASVLVIGAGGLGVVVASYLTAMGVGTIGICDFDTIDATNLHRQFTYTANEIGEKKAIILVKKLQLQNPNVVLSAFTEKMDKNSILSIGANYQLICDCTDNGLSRISIDSYCLHYKKTLIHGAATDWQGYITVFHHKKGFQLQDVFGFPDYLKTENCETIGIISPVCGIIGSYMATETIKVILQLETILEGKILYINTLNNKIRLISLKKSH